MKRYLIMGTLFYGGLFLAVIFPISIPILFVIAFLLMKRSDEE